MPSRAHRWTEIDVLRVVLVFLVVAFHAARVFDPFDFYVKGPEIQALGPVVLLGALCGMPLFFLLAGFALWHSLGRRGPRSLARERAVRLGLPFVLGVLVLVPPQIHMQRLQDGTAGSYWDTARDFVSVRPVAELPLPVDGSGGGPFEPAHLWFLAYLLVFTLLLLPALWPLRRAPARGAAVARRLATGRGLLLVAAAVAAVEALHAAEDAGGWSRWTYPAFLAAGFVLAADDAPWRALIAVRRRALLLGTLGFLALAATAAGLHDRLGDGLLTGHTGEAMAWRAGQGLTGCLLVAAVLGHVGARRERSPMAGTSRLLAWAGAVALPVYLVHQTVGVVLAYPVLDAGVPAGVALLLIAAGTLLISVALAEALRRTPMRVVLGMPRQLRPLRLAARPAE